MNRHLEKLNYPKPTFSFRILAYLKLFLDNIVGVQKADRFFRKFGQFYMIGKSVFVQDELDIGENAAFAFSAVLLRKG